MRRVIYILIIIIIVVVLILMGVTIYKGSFSPFSTSSEWVKEGLVLTSEDYNIQNPEIIKLSNSCLIMYTHGWPKNDNGQNHVHGFYSCDGLKWEYKGVIIKHASLPAPLLLDDGRIRLIFGKSMEINGTTSQGLMSAISSDGWNFTEEDGFRLVTESEDYPGFRGLGAPNIIKLDKGYRMYFIENARADQQEKYKKKGWTWPIWRIKSAYSDDGFNWAVEPGVRIDVEQPPLVEMQRVSGQSVIKVGDEYQMYFFAGFSPWEDLKPYKRREWSGTYMATSKDGVNFNIVDKRLVLGGDVAVVKMGDVLRMYVSEGPLMQQGKNNINSYVKKLP